MSNSFVDYAKNPESLIEDFEPEIVTEAKALPSGDFTKLLGKFEDLCEIVGSERHNETTGEHYDKAVKNRRAIKDALIAAYHEALVCIASSK